MSYYCSPETTRDRFRWASTARTSGASAIVVATLLGVSLGSQASWWAGAMAFIATVVRFAPTLFYREPKVAQAAAVRALQ